jgi:hypothetical protein
MGWAEGQDVPEFEYGEVAPVEGCSDQISMVDITAKGKDGAQFTIEALRYHGGIGERWHLSATPRCTKP